MSKKDYLWKYFTYEIMLNNIILEIFTQVLVGLEVERNISTLRSNFFLNQPKFLTTKIIVN